MRGEELPGLAMMGVAVRCKARRLIDEMPHVWS